VVGSSVGFIAFAPVSHALPDSNSSTKAATQQAQNRSSSLGRSLSTDLASFGQACRDSKVSLSTLETSYCAAQAGKGGSLDGAIELRDMTYDSPVSPIVGVEAPVSTTIFDSVGAVSIPGSIPLGLIEPEQNDRVRFQF